MRNASGINLCNIYQNASSVRFILPILYLPLLLFNIGQILYDDLAYIGGLYLNYFQIRLTLSFVLALLIVLLWRKYWRYIAIPASVLIITFVLGTKLAAHARLWQSVEFLIKMQAFLVCIVLFFKIKGYTRIKVYSLSGTLMFQALLAVAQVVNQNAIVFKPLFWLGQPPLHQLAGYIARIESLPLLEIGNRSWLRSYGTTPHPNILAGLAVLLLILLRPYHRKYPKVWYLSVLATLIIVGLSFSKSAMLILILGGFLWLVYRWKKELLTARRVIVAGILISIIIPICILYANQLGNYEFINTRALLNSGAIELIKQYPASGIGFMGFLPYVIEQNVIDFSILRQIQPVHNVWLLMAGELGVLGTLAIILNYSLLIKRTTQSLWKRHRLDLYLIWIWLIIITAVDHYLITYIF